MRSIQVQAEERGARGRRAGARRRVERAQAALLGRRVLVLGGGQPAVLVATISAASGLPYTSGTAARQNTSVLPPRAAVHGPAAHAHAAGAVGRRPHARVLVGPRAAAARRGALTAGARSLPTPQKFYDKRSFRRRLKICCIIPSYYRERMLDI